jgi:serine protease DegS
MLSTPLITEPAMNDDKPLSVHDSSATTPASVSTETTSAATPPNEEKPRMWRLVLPTCFLLAIVMLLANFLPLVLIQWRRAEAHAEADAIYLRRRAELKAESEVASAELAALDDKAKLVSLGFRYAVAKVLPSVVNVANLKEPADAVGKKRPLDSDHKVSPASVGSGILIRPGYVLTNFHVVQGGDQLRIVFASGRVLTVGAADVRGDPATDLAIIKLPDDVSEPLKEDMKNTVVFADSEKSVHVGDWSLAIGSPMGLRQTVTSGIISAKDRLIDKLDMVELLQTDAAINPGNSGGPLFDQLGRVVGINVALASENGINRGIGFAIPSNTAVSIADALIDHGEVVRGYLGIGMEELPLEKAKLLGVDGAVVVTRVQPGNAGEKAGLQPGDIVVGFNGKPLQSFNAVRHLRQLIIDTLPGSQVMLDFVRNEARRTITAAIAKRPMFLQ